MNNLLTICRTRVMPVCLTLVMVWGISTQAVAADTTSDCPDGMSQVDCAALYGNWPNWLPDTGNSTACGSVDSAPLSGSNHAEQAFNFFMSKPGMTPQAAAGIIGNMQAESYPQLNPTAGDINGPYGIVQWLGGRLDNLKKFAGGNVSDFSTQLDFSWKELSGSYLTSSLKPMESAKTAAAAAYIDYLYYEGPDDGTYPARMANATNIFNLYAGGGNSPTYSTPTDTSGSTSATIPDGDCGTTGSTDTGSCTVTSPVTESQYSQAQLTQIFGNPGTAASHPDIHLTTVLFLGRKVQVSPKVAPCLSAVSAQLSSENVNYTIRMMGCYRFDSDNGTTNIGLRSYHTYGAACDINWDTNPIVFGTAPHDMPQAYIQAFHDHGFTWGGNWQSKKDYMHFEFHGIAP